MLEKPSLSETEIGIDLDMAAAEMNLFVNGVPVFDPAEPFSVQGQLSTTVPVNQSFAPGNNVLHVAVKLDPENTGFTSRLALNVGYWAADAYPMPFDARPMAGGLELQIEERAGVPVEVLVSVPGSGAQPFMIGGPAVRVAGTGVAGTWNTYEIGFDVGLDLPPEKWRAGQMLTADAATTEAVKAELRRVHAGLAGGRQGTMQVLYPMIAQQAAAIGVTVEEYAEADFLPLFTEDDGFVLQPFDVGQSRLKLFGGGRLATLVPVPLQLYSSELDETATLFVYFWKDAQGTWRVIE